MLFGAALEGGEGPARFYVGANAAGGALEHVLVLLEHVVYGGLRRGGEQRPHVRHHVVEAGALRVHLREARVRLL